MMEMTHVQLHLTGSAFALNSVLEGIIQVKKRLDPGSTNLDVLLALLALWDINSRTEEDQSVEATEVKTTPLQQQLAPNRRKCQTVKRLTVGEINELQKAQQEWMEEQNAPCETVFANGVAIFQPDYLAKLEQVTNEQMAPPTETANPTEDITASVSQVPEEHPCTVCPRVFRRKDHLKSHMLVHTGKRVHRCVCCDLSFRTPGELARHRRTSKHLKMLSEQGVPSPGSTPNPEEPPEAPIKYFLCKHCGKVFKRKDHLKSHQMTHEKTRAFSCDICSKSFGYSYHLKRHRQLHFRKTPTALTPIVSADVANLITSTGGPYSQAETTNGTTSAQNSTTPTPTTPAAKQERPYSCTVCSKAFKRKDHLKIHSKIHLRKALKVEAAAIPNETKAPDQGSNDDQLSPAAVGSSSEHTAGVEDDERPYPCDTCDKRFKRRDHLRIHRLVHSNQRSFPCDQCLKCFRTSSHLKRHQIVHTKGFDCSSCGKTFASRKQFLAHLESHPVTELFACLHCGEEIPAGQLPIHERSHRYTFECEECGRVFNKRESYHAHMRQHTGERPYQCDLCDGVFPSSTTRSKHYHSVHGVSVTSTKLNKAINDESHETESLPADDTSKSATELDHSSE